MTEKEYEPRAETSETVTTGAISPPTVPLSQSVISRASEYFDPSNKAMPNVDPFEYVESETLNGVRFGDQNDSSASPDEAYDIDATTFSDVMSEAENVVAVPR